MRSLDPRSAPGPLGNGRRAACLFAISPVTPHNWISEQSRAGMADEGLGVAAIGLEHFKAGVAGHVGDLDQVGATLHRGGHEACPRAVAGKGRSLEPEFGGGSLDDGRDIAGREAPIRDALRALVEDTTEDSALGDPGGLEPCSQRRDRAGDLAAGDGRGLSAAFAILWHNTTRGAPWASCQGLKVSPNDRQMTLENSGFLSPDISIWIEKHRAANLGWFSLAQNFNSVAMQVLSALTVPPDDNKSFLAALLFMRGLSSFQSALVLAERGLTQDARTVTRSCFESVFWLGALRNDANFADMLIHDDFNRRAKIARPLLKLPNGSGLDAEHIDKLERFLDGIRESGSEATQVNIADAARIAGLTEIYDTYYRGLSNDAAHPSITALNRYTEADRDNNIIGLRWGPDVPDVGRTLSDLCTAFIYLLAWTREFFAISDLQEELERYWTDYKQLVESAKAAERETK